ncbi:NACHT, LRR and PYD domains-containing protein 1 homolog isoform X2 [Xyrauchen texanus]|uniref:NACHT, LRR and PYD domains-containing protein 1 homolog isoform X1 n=1 Tax=Xyrauchen texanus TaxID=154827 RepID=UPI002241A677|nr:NACHT, LRR and PYD domains-containing protein 1 homolog isoform X1 [Xyrauchen texanus]XP_051988425.1 NACHT, LRR and PYD domains-containing protein 1 homolog isoform X1 [Xyrauchen texanus]XP_051988430.1 NACHT, LRR and PYD domains-containing protein 1 homolog isoform X2 [Xyrauchen texanus]
MAEGYRDTTKLTRLLSEYVEQAVKLSRLYNIESGFTQSKTNVARAAESLIKAHRKKDIESDIISGIKLITITIEVLEKDSDPVQPCCSSVDVPPRQFTYMERKRLEPKWKQHNKNMIALLKHSEVRKYLGIPKLLQEITSAMDFSSQVSNGCKICADSQDSVCWTLKTPTEGERMQFKVSSTAGKYECSVTGLRWCCDSDVSFVYQIINWEYISDVLESKKYKPCGPLMDITVTTGTLEAVHLPHFLCVAAEPSITSAVRVLHKKDSGEIILEDCNVYPFHAKLLMPTFSGNGVVVEEDANPPVHAEVFIYHITENTAHLTLHMYLIPQTEDLVQKVKNSPSSRGKQIIKPNPENKPRYLLGESEGNLRLNDWYELKIDCVSQTDVTPPAMSFRETNLSFFEIFLKDANEDFVIFCVDSVHKKVVWKANIRKAEYGRGDVSSCSSSRLYIGAEFVEKHRTDLINRVSLVEPIADDLKAQIGDQKYAIVLQSGTSHKKMRNLLSFLTTPTLKEKLYHSLLKHESYLVDDLENSG